MPDSRLGRREALVAIALGALVGCAQEPKRGRSSQAPVPPAPKAEAGAAPDGAPVASAEADAAAAPATPPANRALDPSKRDRLVADAKTTQSDALVIVKDGALVGEWWFEASRVPIETMSITKGVLSLAVGSLIDAKKLELDVPVASFYPVWKNDDRRSITLRHLLSHVSGIDEGKSTAPIYAAKNVIDFSLKSSLLYPPGTHFEYSNRGANLVAGIIAKAAGMPTEKYVEQTLFAPLGIRQTHWLKDQSGQVHGMAGLQLLPRDLAKIGELVLANGAWKDKPIVSREWIELSTRTPAAVQPPHRRLSLFWWLAAEWTKMTIDDEIVAGWREHSVDPALIEKVRPLVGKTYSTMREFLDALASATGDPNLREWNRNVWKHALPDAHFSFGPIAGTYASGTHGQYLVVVPRDRLVVVRMRRSPKDPKQRENLSLAFPDFVERAQKLVVA